MFPHHKVEEQPKKKSAKKGYYSHKRKESDDKNAVAIAKIVSSVGLCHGMNSETLDSQRGRQSLEKTRCNKSWDRFEKYGSHQSTLRQASIREKKGPSLWILTSPKSSSSEVLYAMKFEDLVPWRDWKTTAMRPKKRHGTLPKIYTKLKEKTKLHSTRPRKNGYFLAASTK